MSVSLRNKVDSNAKLSLYFDCYMKGADYFPWGYFDQYPVCIGITLISLDCLGFDR
jgi:hypothetical protein